MKINTSSVAEIAMGVFIALAAMAALGWAISKFTERGGYDQDFLDDDEFEDEDDEWYDDELEDAA